MRKFSSSPFEMVRSFWQNRQLILQMSKREVVGRYRGSAIGLAWSFFNPLLMLAVYTFVFSVVFKARWALDVGQTEDRTTFAVVLFAGLIVFSFFSECATRASTLITANVNYVKKVVFPLETLAFVSFASALFHFSISLLVLLVVQVALGHPVPLTAVLFPIVLLPLAFGALGITWFLSSLAVYLRDIGQLVGMTVAILPFVSAVFFPISSLPPTYQRVLFFNPLAVVIEAGRQVLIFGQIPNFESWFYTLIFGLVLAWGGFAWFQKVRRGFADVL